MKLRHPANSAGFFFACPSPRDGFRRNFDPIASYGTTRGRGSEGRRKMDLNATSILLHVFGAKRGVALSHLEQVGQASCKVGHI